MILLLKDCFGIFVENRLNGARLRVKIIAFCREVSVFLVAQSVKSLPAMWDTWFNPWVGKIPWRRKWQPTPLFLHGEFLGERSLVGYSPWDLKVSDMTFCREVMIQLGKKAITAYWMGEGGRMIYL